MEEKASDLELDVNFIDENVQEERKKHADKEKKTLEQITSLERRILNIDVYQRRENLRLFGIPEQEPDICNGAERLAGTRTRSTVRV